MKPQCSALKQASRGWVADVSLQYRYGRLVLEVPLPSRNEKCLFFLRPMLMSVGDLIDDLQREDPGVTACVFSKGRTHMHDILLCVFLYTAAWFGRFISAIRADGGVATNCCSWVPWASLWSRNVRDTACRPNLAHEHVSSSPQGVLEAKGNKQTYSFFFLKWNVIGS